jgi:two-component system phosphate regulon sensor histidine kinase PhoR
MIPRGKVHSKGNDSTGAFVTDSKTLINCINDPIVILDNTYHIIAINTAGEQIFGIRNDNIVGESLSTVVGSDETVQLLTSESSRLSEWSHGDKTFQPQLETLSGHEGIAKGWILTLRDITHFKKLYRNQIEFVRIVSHDLRSPLTSMQGFASMLGMVGDLNDKQKHFVDKILSGISTMTALVENIQDAGRYDPESGYELNRSQSDLGDLARRIITEHLIPADKSLNITLYVADDLPVVNVDALMIERAVRNLFDNAIKYTPSGGSVHLSVKRQNDNIIIEVRDTGLGIRPQDQFRLFERHVRIHRSEHKNVKGSGLGLFIVRSVARRHDGEAWVESRIGEGTTFFMSIPLDGNNAITRI